MLVTVSVYGAEQATTPTGEPSQPKFLFTRETSVLFLLAIFFAVLLPLRPPQAAAGGPHQVLLFLHGDDHWDSGGGCVQGGTCTFLYAETGHAVGCRAERCWHVCWRSLLLLDNIFVADRAEPLIACIAVEATPILAESWMVLLDIGVTGVHGELAGVTGLFSVKTITYTISCSIETK